MKSVFAILFLGFLISVTSFSQETQADSMLVSVKMGDGNTYYGKLIHEDETTIVLQTENIGEVSLKKTDIKRRKQFPASNLKNGEYWFENPNATRNIYGPTGFGLKKGEGYYQNFWVFLNSVSYGFTDNITIGAGLILIPYEGNLNFNITPKVSFPIHEKINIGLGALYSSILDESLGVVYGVSTFGDRENNLSIGAGYGFLDGEFARSPIFTLSGMTRTTKKIGLVSENWFFPATEYVYETDPVTGFPTKVGERQRYHVIFTYGIRLMFNVLTVDLAFLNNKDIIQEFPIGVPLLGVTIPFGN